MKKITVMVLVMAVGFMFLNPSMGYSNPYDYGRGRAVVVNNYHDYGRLPVRHYENVRYVRSHDNNDGLWVAGAALGGILLGAVIGNAMSQPRYQPAQQVVYTTPASGSPAYAQPDRYSAPYSNDTPPGQWVTVQGQWVNGRWIPAHNVWVPVNP
jgi:hypothetical protein